MGKSVWNIVHDCDGDGGEPTCWSMKTGEDQFLWITVNEKGAFDVFGASEYPLKRDLKSLTCAKRWVTQKILPNLGERKTIGICRKGYEIRAMNSPVGWYLGTVDEEGLPNCILTSQYAKTVPLAEKLPMDRQCAAENAFCNGCGVCFPALSSRD